VGALVVVVVVVVAEEELQGPAIVSEEKLAGLWVTS
jgi:hypothetical protein